MTDRIEALEAENADLKRRLDNICMSIHTCAGDECERPICIANRKNKALEADNAKLLTALRMCRVAVSDMRDEPRANVRFIVDETLGALEGKAHD